MKKTVFGTVFFGAGKNADAVNATAFLANVMFGYIPVHGSPECVELFSAQGFEGMCVGSILSKTHFNKDIHIAIFCNNIDFAAIDRKICFHNGISLVCEVCSSNLLSEIANVSFVH